MNPIFAGVFLVAGSVLLLEVALTRIFAIMLWHHLAYMVVSVAMLGFGAAGSFLTARGVNADRSLASTARALSSLSVAYGFAAMVAVLTASQLPVETIDLLSSSRHLLRLAALYGLITTPFLLAGLVIGLAITRFAHDVNRVYFFDLVGSAAGGLGSVLLLRTLGASSTVMVAAAVGVIAGVPFAMAAGRRAMALAAPAAAAAVVVAAMFSGAASVVGLPDIDWHIPYAPGKEFAGVPPDSDTLRLPSATAEVEVSPAGRLPPVMGGEVGRKRLRFWPGRFVAQDGTAPTMLYEGAADLERFGFLDHSQAASPYIALRARGGAAPRVLVIGVGGGIDVMMALAHGAEHVTAVEVNRAMVELVTDHFGEYLGGLFLPGAHENADRVELVHGDGRSFVRGTDERYDVIQLAGVDSFTALSTGAYTLSESYLYTTEAIRDFYDHLVDDGYLSYSRFILSRPRKPRETLRLANVAYTALAELGVEDPASQIAVLRAYNWASTIVKKSPFTDEEIQALHDLAKREEFWGLVFDPLYRSADGATVDLPVPSFAADEGAEAAEDMQQTRADFYRLLRGDTAARDAFVTGYEYDLSPAEDDAPFFFNYYRWRGLFSGRSTESSSAADIYHSDFPVGHAVLLASLAQLGLFAAVLVLLPLRVLPPTSSDTATRLRVFAYFAALGAGFMLIEITLMQKMILFLGHPTHAVSVVLSVLLAAAGAGSYVAGRLSSGTSSDFWKLGAGIAALSLLLISVFAYALPALLGAPFAARVVVAALLITPLGMVLGMAFPSGIRVVERRCPELLPWAWAINAFLSVMSGILCIVLAMRIGFSNVWLLAVGVYIAGIALFAPLADPVEKR